MSSCGGERVFGKFLAEDCNPIRGMHEYVRVCIYSVIP